MKRKKILSLILALVMLCSAFCTTALAVDNSQSFSFTLTVDGKSSVEVKAGDEITVSFFLKRTDKAENWAMYAWQTEIAYDANAFQVVEDSVTAPSGVGSSLHKNGNTGKVYFNDFSMSKSGSSYPAELGACSFKLRVIGGGDYTIRNTNFGVSTKGGTDTYAVTSSDLKVSAEGIKASEKFSDVAADSWYEDAVSFVVNRGLFTGTGDGTTFSPNAAMTRAMLVTVLWRMEGQPAVNSVNEFNDVAEDAWYTDAVLWANANKVVEGYGDGRFGTNDNVNREQIATILYRYAKLKGYDVGQIANLSDYMDATSISGWAETGMSWANAAGLITGRTTTTLAPQGTAGRAEVATILMRFVTSVQI